MDPNSIKLAESKMSPEMNSERQQQRRPEKPALPSPNEAEKFVHIELYKSARKATLGRFQEVLQQVSMERNESQSTIIRRVKLSGSSLLHAAVSNGNEDVASFIAENFPSLLLDRNAKGETALHIAVRRGILSMVRVVLSSRHGDFAVELMGMRNEEGNTALHEAVMNGFFEVAKILISMDSGMSICVQNKEGWSPLCIAIKNGDLQMFKFLLQSVGKAYSDLLVMLEGNPPAHTAIWEGRIGMLELMAEENNQLLKIKDAKGRTPLNWAADRGDFRAVRLLLSHSPESCFETDNDGYLPLHSASASGHLRVIKQLLKPECCPTDPAELLTSSKGQNILHAAAANGRDNVVRYILGNPMLRKLLNERDNGGNTALHLAAQWSNPSVVLTLTWAKGIELHPHNNNGLNPLDVFFKSKLMSYFERQLMRDDLTLSALLSAGCKVSWDPEINKKPPINDPNSDTNTEKEDENIPDPSEKPPKIQWMSDNVGALLTIATLVATGTFTAGFTTPGGYTSSGIPTYLNDHVFHFFTICNATSFYCSILCVISCLFTKFADIPVAGKAYNLALGLFGVALVMMALAFIAGVQLSVNKLSWLTCVTLVIGIAFLVLVFLGWISAAFPLYWSKPLVVRYVSYYISRVLIFLFLSDEVVTEK